MRRACQVHYTSGMSSRVDDVVRMHRVENAKREAVWLAELERRRRELAEATEKLLGKFVC